MPWKKSDGTIVEIGKSWVDDNKIRHPSNWSIWTDDYKKSMGFPVTIKSAFPFSST